jgi:hypothetical protein
MAASGTTKKITSNQILGAGGTATLASATITGDLTVDTNVLKVDTSNNRVGVNKASPTVPLDVVGASIFTVADAAYATALNATTGNLRLYPYYDANYGSALLAFNAGYAGYGPLTLDASRLSFYISGSEAMRLNSTGLGVGGSPSAKLSVTGGNIRIDNNQGVEWGGANNYIYGSEATDFIAIVTNGVEALRIDNSQNVGVGVTPSSSKLQVAGNIGLPNSCTASGETSGVFSIDVANLLALTGGSWRQCSFLLVYSGVDTGLGNSTVLQTVVTLQGLSTYDTISKNDIVGTASVAVSNDTSSGARITVTVPTGNAGSVYVMLLGGAGATTRPSITINA